MTFFQFEGVELKNFRGPIAEGVTARGYQPAAHVGYGGSGGAPIPPHSGGRAGTIGSASGGAVAQQLREYAGTSPQGERAATEGESGEVKPRSLRYNLSSFFALFFYSLSISFMNRSSHILVTT